jgi:hypothetical protein
MSANDEMHWLLKAAKVSGTLSIAIMALQIIAYNPDKFLIWLFVAATAALQVWT